MVDEAGDVEAEPSVTAEASAAEAPEDGGSGGAAEEVDGAGAAEEAASAPSGLSEYAKWMDKDSEHHRELRAAQQQDTAAEGTAEDTAGEPAEADAGAAEETLVDDEAGHAEDAGAAGAQEEAAAATEAPATSSTSSTSSRPMTALERIQAKQKAIEKDLKKEIKRKMKYFALSCCDERGLF